VRQPLWFLSTSRGEVRRDYLAVLFAAQLDNPHHLFVRDTGRVSGSKFAEEVF
jgi:hypothetical protein